MVVSWRQWDAAREQLPNRNLSMKDGGVACVADELNPMPGFSSSTTRAIGGAARWIPAHFTVG